MCMHQGRIPLLVLVYCTIREGENESEFCHAHSPGPSEKIHAFLNVDLYVPVVPLAPLEELHASAVQHPEHAHMRWLLNTRRVPVLTGSAAKPPAGSATEHPVGNAASTVASSSSESLTSSSDADPRPPCAGIGDAEKSVWLCKECAAHLCRPEPKMPPKALAN